MTDYEHRIHRQALYDQAASARGQAAAGIYLNKKARTRDFFTLVVAAIGIVIAAYTLLYTILLL